MAWSAPTILEIELQKGTKGLGFNIRGGTDNTYIGSEPGIFVTSIKVDGAAFQDGRLQVGDKILEVNGINLREVTHKEAVKYFQESDDIVRLIVEKAAEARIRQEQFKLSSQTNISQSDGGDQSTAYRLSNARLSIAAVAIAVVLIAVTLFAVNKMRRH